MGKVENAKIKVSFYNLHDESKFNYTKIILENAKINFNLEKFKKYINYSKKEFNSKPISLTKGEISFSEGKKNIAIIKNANFKFNSFKDNDKATLKGEFLGDKINISFR